MKRAPHIIDGAEFRFADYRSHRLLIAVQPTRPHPKGIGYFQDVAVASAGARHAVVVGNKGKDLIRSSSAMLLELIEYNRVMESLQAGMDPSHRPELLVCNYLQIHSHKIKQQKEKAELKS